MNLPFKAAVLATAIGLASLVSQNVVAHPHQPGGPEQRDRGAAAHRGMKRERLAEAARNHPELAVAMDLRRLEMLYRRQQDEAAIVAMYQDVLKRTQHPKLRAFAERRLQQADRRAHPERSIAELRGRIDEQLKALR